MPERYPDLPPRAIQRKAATLGLTNRPGARRLWIPDQDYLLGWLAGMKTVALLAKKLNRMPAAIWKRLSGLGLSAKVPLPDYFNLHQVSRMLGVSDSIVLAWYEKSLFEPYGKVKLNGHARSNVLIHEDALVVFCLAHPEKVNPKKCPPDVLDCMEEKKIAPRRRNGCRQHLRSRNECRAADVS